MQIPESVIIDHLTYLRFTAFLKGIHNFFTKV